MNIVSLLPLTNTSRIGVQSFFFRHFTMSWCLSVFSSIGFLSFFLYFRCISAHSIDLLFLTLFEFQFVHGPRGGVGVRIEQKSRSKFLPWPGFEPRTSHLASWQSSTQPLDRRASPRMYYTCITQRFVEVHVTHVIKMSRMSVNYILGKTIKYDQK